MNMGLILDSYSENGAHVWRIKISFLKMKCKFVTVVGSKPGLNTDFTQHVLPLVLTYYLVKLAWLWRCGRMPQPRSSTRLGPPSGASSPSRPTTNGTQTVRLSFEQFSMQEGIQILAFKYSLIFFYIRAFYGIFVCQAGKSLGGPAHPAYLLLILSHCMSKKSWPILYRNLLYKMGQDFLDIKYIFHCDVKVCFKIIFNT